MFWKSVFESSNRQVLFLQIFRNWFELFWTFKTKVMKETVNRIKKNVLNNKKNQPAELVGPRHSPTRACTASPAGPSEPARVWTLTPGNFRSFKHFPLKHDYLEKYNFKSGSAWSYALITSRSIFSTDPWPI